ncbi:MAG: type II toxin-antitoxin system PemK/MazF family toxin [Candidatus Sericytochromatia bacterium]|nr:type II toxin-antitoxin system PemK/MazF family toxin [Candidatus Sericytochromatia bacterium]
MPPESLVAGDVAWAIFPEHVPGGHEQEGRRPAVIVAVPDRPTRYPILWVAPVTTRQGPWQTANPQCYPGLQAGAGGLPRPSFVLLDQLRAIDASRLSEFIGTLPGEDFGRIVAGLRLLLRL